MALLAAERRAEERERTFVSRLGADDPSPQRQDVHVVVLDALMGGVRVVADGRAKAAHLVDRDARADPGAADEDPAVGLVTLDGEPELLREVRVVVVGIRAVPAEVDELVAETSGREPAKELV